MTLRLCIEAGIHLPCNQTGHEYADAKDSVSSNVVIQVVVG